MMTNKQLEYGIRSVFIIIMREVSARKLSKKRPNCKVKIVRRPFTLYFKIKEIDSAH